MKRQIEPGHHPAGAEARVAELEREIEQLRTALATATRDRLRSDNLHDRTKDRLGRAEESTRQLRKANAALLLSEEHARLLVEAVKGHSIFTTDAGGRVVDWTSGAEAVFGWAADEIVGRSSDLLYTPEDLAADVPAQELATARAEGCANDERWHVGKGGKRVFINGSVRALHDERDEIVGFIKIGRDETERRAREAHLAAIFDQLAIGMSEGDATGRFLRVNDRFCEITGRSRDELLSLRMHDITHPDDLPGNAPLYDQTTRGGAPFEIEKRYLRPDGSIVWVHNSVTPLRDADGRPISTICATVDITDRKRAEEAQRASEARLRKVLETETVGIVFFDFVGGIHQANDAFLRMIGYTREELEAGKVRYERLTPPDWRWRDEKTIAELKATGKAEPFEKEYTRKDDSRLWILCADKLIDEHTAVEFIIDVTERKQAEKALREGEARLRALTDNLPAGMVYQIATGTDGRERQFLYVSQSHEKLTGVPAEAVLADPTIPYNLIMPEDRDRLTEAEAEAIRERRPFDIEARFRRTDGEVRWCRIISAPREQADGSVIWDGIQIDTTEQKATEAALRELNETLEARIAERTIELEQAHEQLRQSQKLEAMGQLTGGVSHDFNNLLSPIIGSLDLLQRKGLGGERERRLIEGALQSAERARVLVQRLLAFARRQPLQPKPVDLGSLVSGMAGLVASTTGPQIKVVVNVADDLPAAVADANQVEMAILNLSVNARDAMPEGGTLRISAEEEAVGAGHRSELRPGRYVRLSVADTGTGMDEATLKRAVEPFFSTKGIGKGTGLGLSMVHGLAAQLGGALTISSKVGLGTNVEIWLPTSEAKPDDLPNADDAALPATAVGTALLVDDEEFVRDSTADMLTDLGYAVVEAGSAEEALRLVESGLVPDLLVTDHLMPGKTGNELAHELRGRWRDLPVLLVSGYAEAEGIAPDLVRLIKPFRQTDLIAKLGELDGASTG